MAGFQVTTEVTVTSLTLVWWRYYLYTHEKSNSKQHWHTLWQLALKWELTDCKNEKSFRSRIQRLTAKRSCIPRLPPWSVVLSVAIIPDPLRHENHLNVMPNEPEQSNPLEEIVFTAEQLAKAMRLHSATIRKLFVDEPGVMRLGHPGDGRRRQYFTLRIPASVAERVFRKLTVGGGCAQ